MDDKIIDLFGYGVEGIPSDVELLLASPGLPEHMASEIIKRWHSWADEKMQRGRTRVADSQLAPLQTMIFVIVLWYRKRRKQPPPVVINALACMMGLVASKSGRPLPNWEMLREASAPAEPDTDEASPRERFATSVPGIPDNVTKRAEWLRATAVRGERLANREKRSINAEAKAAGVSRSTIRKWEQAPAYENRAKVAAALTAMAPDIYRRWNAQRTAFPSSD